MFLLTLWGIATAQQRNRGASCNLNTRLAQQPFNLPTSDFDQCSRTSFDGRKFAGVRMVNSKTIIEIWDLVAHTMLVSHSFKGLRYTSFSPHLEQAVITGGRNGWELLDLRTGNRIPIPGEAVAWDGEDLAAIKISASPETSIAILNYTSGVIIKRWTPLSPNNSIGGACWFPSPWLSMGVSVNDGTTDNSYLTRYLLNGTLISATPIKELGSLLCNSWGMVGSATGYRDGTIVKMISVNGREVSLQSPTTVSPFLGDNIIVMCFFQSNCKLYGTQLELLLELPETAGHKGLGLSPGVSGNFITYSRGKIYQWEMETPFVRSAYAARNVHVQWIDRDSVLASTGQLDELPINSNSYGLNVRTGRLNELPINSNLYCVMKGEIYTILTSTIAVFAHVNEVRRWDLPAGYTPNKTTILQCSIQGDVLGVLTENNTTHIMHWLVWSSTGVLLQNILVKDLELYDGLALYNASLWATVKQSAIQFWNPHTSTWEPPFYQQTRSIVWSPNGAWLLALQDTSLVIFNGTREVAMKIEDVRLGGVSWSPDSNWLIMTGSPPLLICPSLNSSTIMEGMSFESVWWNPELSTEILSFVLEGATLLTPIPSIMGLLAGKYTNVPSPASVMVIGANFLPPVVKTMLRWVDSSTGEAQCMILNATTHDAYTLSLGNITLPDPALYTVHIRAPTFHPYSPWLTSPNQFGTRCQGVAGPVISETGGLTTCACPHENHYTIPTNVSEVQCGVCPEHGVCDGSTLVTSKEGYWPKSEDPYKFLPCAAGVCPGNNQCLQCHEGPLCGLCSWKLELKCGQHGYGRCRACKPVWQDILLIIAALLCWILFCTIQSLFALGWRQNKSRGNNSAQLAATIVSTTQMNALLLSVDVRVDSLSQTLGYAEEKTQSGGVQSAVFSCVLLHYGLSPGHVHFVKQVGMLLLPMVGWIMLVGYRRCLRCRGITTSTSTNTVKVSTVVLWSSLQSAITTSLFQTLACDDVHSQEFKSRLSHDLSVPCFGNTYWTFLGVVTIPVLIVTVLVIPLTFAWLLRYRPLAGESGYLRFLVKSYRNDWWYLVIFYRKVLLSMIVTFTKDPFLVAITLLGSTLLHLLTWPSTSFLVNVSESCSLVACAYIFGVAGAVGIRDKKDDYGAIQLLSVGACSYLVQIGLLFYDRWSTRRGRDEEDNDAKVDQCEHDRLLVCSEITNSSSNANGVFPIFKHNKK